MKTSFLNFRDIMKWGLTCLILIPFSAYAQKPDNSVVPAATARLLPSAYPVGTKVNYVRTKEPKRPISDPASVIAATNISDIAQTTDYFDGLGRRLQTVSLQLSPSGKDFIKPVNYDYLGREVFRYLPYTQQISNTNDGKLKLDPFGAQAQFYSNTTLNPGMTGETVYYGKTEFEPSPLSRPKKILTPGNSWVGAGRGVGSAYLINTVQDNVQNWTIAMGAGSLPQIGPAYAAGTLVKNVTENEHGRKTVEFKNKTGQVVLKRAQLTSGADGHDGWLCTYYVYDDLGNLRFLITPKAVDVIKSNWIVTTSIADELCFRYEYDHRLRIITKQLPGAKAEEVVYDIRDRVVFSQNGELKKNNQWHTTFYDEMNRPIMTALYTTTQTPAQLRTSLLDASMPGTITRTIPAAENITVSFHDGRPVYKAKSSITLLDGFDSGSGEMETELNAQDIVIVSVSNPLPALDENQLYPLTYTYYDEYNYPGRKNQQPGDFNKTEVATDRAYYEERPSNVSTATHGVQTGSKVRVLNTDMWLTTSTYYDNKGRIIQQVADNIAGGENITSMLYDFKGKLLSKYERYGNPSSSQTASTSILTIHQYDLSNRLTNIYKQINDNSALRRHIVRNTYDELGRLENRSLGERSTNEWIEDLTYEYNVRGWIQGINKDYGNAGTGHYFGMELFYDHGFDNKVYNGNMAGIKWKGFNDPARRAYGFSYDAASRFMKAEFNQYNGSVWDKSAGINYDVSMGDGITPSLAYDANGNIKKMQQWGFKTGGSALIDNLDYTYDDPGSGYYSNKLKKITDAVPNDPVAKLGDFMDLNPNTTTDYLYDDNGNMYKDENKGIQSVVYNHLNLPQLITISGKGTIRFVYDAAGNKLQKVVTDNTGSSVIVTTTDYVDGLVFENTKLKLISHEEGRARPVFSNDILQTFVYDYFLKDHLGNVRSVVTEETGQYQYMATMETQYAAKENSLFTNIDATRSAKPVGYPQDATTSNNASLAKLNANSQDRKIGPSLVLKVMAGDTVQIGAKAYYKSIGSSQKKTTLPASDMLAALAKAFLQPGQPVSGKGASGTGNNSPFNEQFISNDYQRMKEQEPGQELQGNRPKAYLNFVLFDEQLKLVKDNSGVKQVQAQPDEIQTLAQDKMVMKKSGFLYVYASNETPQDVYFDNIIVNHAPGALLEETHYYPYGLAMTGISAKAIGKPENKYLYNGKELQSNEFSNGGGLDWYDYGARFYDAQIGRWHKIDNKAELYQNMTPYAYAANQPTNAIDPDGNLIIFINGMAPFTAEKGQSAYWREYEKVYAGVRSSKDAFGRWREEKLYMSVEKRAFDKEVSKQLKDDNRHYVNGQSDLSAMDRIDAGRDKGYAEAGTLIAGLHRTDNVIDETIKIITHSMGGAYGKGYVEGIKKYLDENPDLKKQVKITLVADFDPFQGGRLFADFNIKTMQFKHSGPGRFAQLGWLANQDEYGVAPENIITNTDKNIDHSILTFFGDIKYLEEGSYEWDSKNKKWTRK